MTARIVVTGVGAIAPTGLGAEEVWDAALTGRSGLRRFARFDPGQYPTQVGGEITDFAAAEHVPGRLLPQTDRTTRFAVAATEWALRDAAVDVGELGEYDVGVVTANGCGGFEFGQRELQKLWSEGPHRVSAYQSFAWFYAVNTGQLSIRHGVKGHSSVVVTEQAGGLDALAAARRHVRKGSIRVAIAGGIDAPISPWGLTAQLPNGLLSEEKDPARAYLPFDRAAGGYVPGEGGAILILEELGAAIERGAPSLHGEIAGHASTFDPPPSSGRPSSLPQAILGALDDANLRPGDVDVVLADAAGVPDLDSAEAAALNEVFGPRGVPVAVPKTTTGRLYSGGAPLDVFSALMMMRDGVIPAAANLADIPEEYALDVVTGRSRKAYPKTAVVIARGFGGFNSALVLRAL
ncbi:ketosynthase chain-length factor [Amycolatopsis japonica]